MRYLGVIITLLAALTSFSAVAQEKVHYVAIHVDQSDPKIMNLALNNVQNLRKYYEQKGEKVTIEVVTYGPGLNMLRADKSPVKTRIATMSLEIPELRFSACGTTQGKMSKKEGKKIELLSEANLVPSGVVRLIELQEKGYAYIRP